MNETLVLLLDRDPASRGWWQVFDRSGNGIGLPRQGPLAEPAAQATGRRVIGVVPGEHVVMHHARLPARAGDKLALAAAGLLEERCAADLEDLHFVPGEPDTQGEVAVAVVERDLLAAWLATLGGAGLEPVMLVPDFLALPAGPGWTLAVHDGRLAVRTGRQSGSAGPVPLVLASLLMSPLPEQARVMGAAGDTAAVAAALRERGVSVQEEERSELEIVAALTREARRPALDLRTGPFRARDAGRADLARWRLPVALAAVLTLVVAGQAVTDVWRASRELTRLDADIRALYQPLLPGVQNIDIARLELENQLARRAGGGATAALLSELAALGAAATAGGAVLERVERDAGRWSLSVSAPDLATLERLRDQASAALARPASLDGAANEGGRATGRIQVEAAR